MDASRHQISEFSRAFPRDTARTFAAVRAAVESSKWFRPQPSRGSDEWADDFMRTVTFIDASKWQVGTYEFTAQVVDAAGGSAVNLQVAPARRGGAPPHIAQRFANFHFDDVANILRNDESRPAQPS